MSIFPSLDYHSDFYLDNMTGKHHNQLDYGIEATNNISFFWGHETRSYNTNNVDEFMTEMDSKHPKESLDSGGSLGFTDLALVSLFCSIIAGTVAGNTLVIAAVLTTRRLRTVTNCFVMSLAVADWLVGVFVMPPKVALYLVHNKWKLGGFLCEVWIALDILLCTASILSLCAISIDRYLAITRPLAYSRRRRSKRLALSMISCVWVAAAVITSPPIFGWYDESRNVEESCGYNENTGYVVYSALGSFFLPLLVMLYVYARIACVIARRQTSIQRLSNSSETKTHFLGGNDAEEPLRCNQKGSHFGRKGVHHDAKYVKPPPPEIEEEGHNSTGKDETVGVDEIDKESSYCWGLLHPCQSCTGRGDEDKQSGSGAKRSSSGGQKSVCGSSESDSNSASGLALSLPDPATLSGGIESVEIDGSAAALTTGRSSLPVHSTRMRTGSRLCHHSIVTTSPQRNIHRVHQATSSTTRLFLEHEIIPLDDRKILSKSTPRIWTVEEQPSLPGRQRSPLGATASLKREHRSRNSNSSGGAGGTTTGLSLPMSDSPGGNPASIMSSPNSMGLVVVGNEISPSRNATRNCHSNTSTRHVSYNNHNAQPTPPFHPHHPPPTATYLQRTLSGRGRSMKLKLSLHDHNQNGSTINRDFSSGSRVASFKRETKTAQTLAAVVGGFIICWLPFFVAYVIGPFLPQDIPISLMDALIWLGWSNSTINPFIYALYNIEFRSAFWRLTVRKCGIFMGHRHNNGRRSPRRYDDHNNTPSRIST